LRSKYDPEAALNNPTNRRIIAAEIPFGAAKDLVRIGVKKDPSAPTMLLLVALFNGASGSNLLCKFEGPSEEWICGMYL